MISVLERKRAMGICVMVGALLGAGVARSDDTGIVTVVGTGVVSEKAAVAEIVAVASGEAELAADAVVKFQGSRRRALEAVKALGVANLTVKGLGIKISHAAMAGGNNAMAMMMGQAGNTNLKPKTEFSEQLSLRLAGIDELSSEDLLESLVQILDAVKDAGLTIGESRNPMASLVQMQMGGGGTRSMVTFKLGDASAARKQAYGLAMKSAREKAAHLAELSGRKLGGVRSVSETTSAAQSGGPQAAVQAFYEQMFAGGADAGSGDSSELAEIPVTVTLTIVFELKD